MHWLLLWDQDGNLSPWHVDQWKLDTKTVQNTMSTSRYSSWSRQYVRISHGSSLERLRLRWQKLTSRTIGINAFLYMTLGRMVQFFLPEQRLVKISAQRFGLIFVCLDIFAFIIQLIGVGILVQTDASNDTVLRGVHIYMGGIAIQETFIIGFIGLTIHLHRKLLYFEKTGGQLEKMTNLSFNWRWLFYTMYFALTMITVSESRNLSSKITPQPC